MKAYAQPDRKTYSSMTDIEFDEWLYVHGVCTNKPIPRKIVKLLIEDAINETLSAQPEQRWIPVSERLPYMWDERYLVSLAWGGIGVMEYKSTGFHNYGSFTPVPIESITAWMPLPEPYKEEQDG